MENIIQISEEVECNIQDAFKMFTVNELLENFQWGSKNADIENIKEEAADIFGYLLLLCNELNIELLDVTYKKIDINNKKYPIVKAFGSSKKYNRL